MRDCVDVAARCSARPMARNAGSGSATSSLEPISKLRTAVDPIKCRMIRLTDEQWERIRDHFPEENIADGRPGRKPTPTRCVLEAVLWILNTGAQWHMLPQSYPNYKTVHRRFQTWCRDEVLRRVLTDVANELCDRGALNEEECFIDATFVMAGGGLEIGATKRGKGMKIMAIVDRHGLPLSVSTHAANHHEVPSDSSPASRGVPLIASRRLAANAHGSNLSSGGRCTKYRPCGKAQRRTGGRTMRRTYGQPLD